MALRVITFKVNEKLLEKLDIYANEMGISRSELIRMAIEHLLENFERNEIFEKLKQHKKEEPVLVIA